MVVFNFKIDMIMKKINKLFALLPLIAAFFMTACSNEEEIAQNNAAFEGYKFKVNAYFADGTRATGDTAIKKEWEHNDAIYFVIDDKTDDILTLVYDTLAKTWDTKALENAPEFAASGKIKAVYADVLSYDATNGIRTKGDIITTEDGTYTKDGNVIQIILPMNNRPVMKVTIVGLPDAFPCIKDFRECTYLNFATMKFTDDKKFGLSNREQAISYVKSPSGMKISGAYNYYGYFDDNVTGKFSLATANRSSFWENKTHEAASMQKGYQYVVKGPGNKEGVNDWTPIVKVLPVAKSKTMEICAGSIVRLDSLFTYQYGNPENLEYDATSSNNVVLALQKENAGKTWKLKAIENEDDRGSSQIVVKKDSEAQFNVTVEKRKSVDGVLGMSFKVDSIIKRIVADNPTNAFSYCANEFFAAGSTYTYNPGDPNLAEINNGIVTMKALGEVIITATNNENGLQFSFKINIQDIKDYISVIWGDYAFNKSGTHKEGTGSAQVDVKHDKGVKYTVTNGLGKNVYGMKLSGTTLSDVKEITVTSIRVKYVTGAESNKTSIPYFYQVGNTYADKDHPETMTNKLKAGEKGAGYYALDNTPLSWHINSTATIAFTFDGKPYEKEVPSSNATPQ